MSLAETVPSLIKSAYQHALECTPTPSNGLPTAYTVASKFQTVSQMGDGLDQLLIKPSSEVGVVTSVKRRVVTVKKTSLDNSAMPLDVTIGDLLLHFRGVFKQGRW